MAANLIQCFCTKHQEDYGMKTRTHTQREHINTVQMLDEVLSQTILHNYGIKQCKTPQKPQREIL